ncbi:rab effector MyRIP-like [Arapaima gigas]
MGKTLDLSSLTEEEVEHVLEVVRRDMRLRRKEEDRLREMRLELEEEDTRCLLLSKQELFNKRCCIRCCSPFSFLLNRKRLCADCGYNVCRRCRSFHKEARAWLCTACQKSRLLRRRSLEWYYSVLKRRFRRFGSTKVLKSLYRKYITDQGILAELTEGSVCDESVCNEGSDSDSPFRRQSEDHNMAETLNVALQVAEEAVEEAIARTEEHCNSLEKQDEVRYLQDNKDELIEELATSIVQKIIRRRRKLSQMQPQYEMDLPQQCGEGASSPSSLSRQNTIPSQASLKGANSLWRSCSAFSLTSDTAPEETVPEQKSDSSGEVRAVVKGYASLRRDTVASLASWKSVDRLDNSMLQSPDGNWIALQSTQLSRPSLLTKRKSLVFSALEQESGSVSAYHDLGSDTEPEADGGWGAALLEFRRKMSQRESEWTDIRGASTGPPSPQLPTDLGMPGTPDIPGTPCAPGSPTKSQLQLLSSLRRMGRRQSGPRCSIGLDINLNPDLAGSGSVDSSEVEDGKGDGVRRSRRRRRTKQEPLEVGSHSMQFSSSIPDYSNLLLNVIVKKNLKLEGPAPSSNLDHPAITSHPITSSPLSSDVKNTESVALCAKDLGPVGLLEMRLNSTLCERSGQTMEETGENGGRKENMAADRGCSEEIKNDTNKAGQQNGAEPPMDGKRIEEVEADRPAEKDKERQVNADPEHAMKNQAKRHSLQQDSGQIEVHMENEDKSDGGGHIMIEEEIAGESDSVIDAVIMSEGLQEMDGEIEVGEEVGFLTEMNENNLKVDVEVEVDAQVHIENPEQTGMIMEKIELDVERPAQVAPEEHRELEKGSRDEAELEDKEQTTEREGESTGKMDMSMLADTLKIVEEKSEGETEGSESNPADLQQKAGEEGDKQMIETSMEGKLPDLETVSVEDIHRVSACNIIPSHKSLKSLPILCDPEQKYSAASLSSITTEVLKVLNATEELIEEVGGGGQNQAAPTNSEPVVPAEQSVKKLDQHLTKLEENVYLAAGTVFKLEGELLELEECARSISSNTTEDELAHLEEQVASAAAQVQQSNLQVSGIAARISALKSAGLNVAPSAAPQKVEPTQTIAVSRQQRRKLPHPPTRKGSEHKTGPKSRVLRS